MPDIVFEITKHFGVLSEEKSGWKKELNLVSWNNRAPKLDIRDWSPDHEKMGKGVTLSKEEAQKLMELLQSAVNSLT
uniref:Transcriptional coactivator p15 (PC4) C-terminal domain-containing protein n=1 Tax=Gracilinema caldarium TaxID=215591 RepID=A0A7C3IQC0_9SPIR